MESIVSGQLPLSSSACAVSAAPQLKGCKSPPELLQAEARNALLEKIVLHAFSSVFVIFTCEPRPVIWQESCLEGCKIECGNAQEALHKPDFLLLLYKEPRAEALGFPAAACPSLRENSIFSSVSSAFSFSNLSACCPPPQFPLPSPCKAMAGYLCRRDRAPGDGGGETASAHPRTVNGGFPCFYPKPFVGLCG